MPRNNCSFWIVVSGLLNLDSCRLKECCAINRMDDIESFLAELFNDSGPEAVIDCLSFLHSQFVVTQDGKVLAANEAFIELIGYNRSELYGTSSLELVVPEDRDELKMRLALDKDERYHIRLLTKSGAVQHVLVSPRVFVAGDRKYRFAELINNTDIINLQHIKIQNLRNTASALTRAIEYRDPYTQGHMSRTAYISVKIAEMLQLDGKTIEAIALGASLHDIGKISVPIEILTKPGELEPFEWEFIKRHPQTGYDILAGVSFSKTVMDIVLLHHEHQDGSGYPYGYQQDEIPIEVAIVGVADCLDAIAGVRPYRKAYSYKEAIALLENEAQKHHKEVLAAARRLLALGELDGREYDPGY